MRQLYKEHYDDIHAPEVKFKEKKKHYVLKFAVAACMCLSVLYFPRNNIKNNKPLVVYALVEEEKVVLTESFAAIDYRIQKQSNVEELKEYQSKGHSQFYMSDPAIKEISLTPTSGKGYVVVEDQKIQANQSMTFQTSKLKFEWIIDTKEKEKINTIQDQIRVDVLYKNRQREVSTIYIRFDALGQMMVSNREGKSVQQYEEELEDVTQLDMNELYDIAKLLIPETMFDEILTNGVISQENHHITISNNADHPTLVFEFIYNKNNLIEYKIINGDFMTHMNKVNKQPKALVEEFQDAIFSSNETIRHIKTEDHQEYYEDNSYEYVVRSDKNILVSCKRK